MDETQMIKIVEGYSRKSEPSDGQVKVTRVPDYKTVYIEQVGGSENSIVMSEYKVNGKSYWAGYSSLSETVFVSQTGRD